MNSMLNDHEKQIYAALEAFVGKEVGQVHKALEDELAPYAIQYVEVGSIVTADFQHNRIRCWYFPTTKIIEGFTLG